MTVFIQIVIGLLTTFVGFLLGLAWHISHQRVTYWRARRFWRPFVSSNLKIVVGRFREFDDFEISGLVGVGDMQAAAELVSFLGRLGLRALGRSVDIIYHDQLTGDLYGSNLVCIGGPDANRATERILNRIDCTIAAGDSRSHDISFRDTKTGNIYSPISSKGLALYPSPHLIEGKGNDSIALDYGLLVKAPNPFNPQCSVLVFAGGFGYGSWAGVKLTQLPQFLGTQSVSAGEALECLYKTEVIEEIPQRPEVVILRRIAPRGLVVT